MRFRALLPQLLLTSGLALATGHLWLVAIPLLTAALLSGQTFRAGGNDAIRQLTGRIWHGNRRLGVFPWLWPSGVREQVLLLALQCESGQLASNYRTELEQRDKSPLLGIAASGAAVRLGEFEALGHLLIIGATGSGKTELLRNLLPQLRGDCWCADYKGGSGLSGLRRYRRLTTNLEADREQFWQAAAGELARREQLQANGIASPATYLIIDELAAAMNELTAQRTIDSIARKGRGLGLHLLAASQNLSGLPRSIWTNLHTRILLAPADLTDALQLGIDAALVKSLQSHQGVIRTPDESAAFWFPISGDNRKKAANCENPLLDFSGQVAKDF